MSVNTNPTKVTCNGGGCAYKTCEGYCNYFGYCDYQCPKDSRGQPFFVMQQDDVCICAGGSNSGGRCVVCGKKK